MSRPLGRIESEHEGDVLRLRLLGEIDLSNVTTLQGQIEALIDDASPARVMVDLSEVDYIDSQGVMLLLEVATTLRARATRLELIAPAGSVAAQLLAISHVQDLPVEGLNGH